MAPRPDVHTQSPLLITLQPPPQQQEADSEQNSTFPQNAVVKAKQKSGN